MPGWGTLSAMELLRTPEERFADLPGYPFEPRYVALPDGLRMHYVDEGPAGRRDRAAAARPADVVLPLPQRGGPAGRARAAGRGARPHRLRPLGQAAGADGALGRAHVDWMAQFTDALGLEGVTLVVQDWGGPIGLGVLAARPGLVRRVVAANTALHTADAALAGRLAWACTTTATARSPSSRCCSTTSASPRS